jgi:hypothetical protein
MENHTNKKKKINRDLNKLEKKNIEIDPYPRRK